MAKMTSIYVGVSGLHSAQTALNTTTHNLANVYTPGYTRQLSFTADKTYNTIGQSYTSAMQVGLGVSTVETSRVRDILLDKSYRTENGRQGFYAAEYEVALEIQTIIGETEGVRFQQTLEDVWSSINEMAKTPDSIVSRSELVMNAELFIDRAKNIYTELIDYQKNIDTKVVNIVNKINSLGDEINALNLKISGIEAPELEDANDLRDRRDLLLDELSGLVKINYNEDENSYVSVMVEGVPFITDGGVFHMGIQELDGDKGSVYSTCVWPYLDNQEVFHLEEPITTDNKNDIGNIKGYLLARGDFIGSYKDVPEVSDYDVSTPDGYNEYMEAVAIYNKTVECCSIVKTQALFDKLIHNVVTAINDVLSPTTDEVPAGVTQYTDANGNVYNASDVKILDMTTSTGNDGKMPPEELFSRKYTDRYVEVTGDDGNTYYMLNNTNTLGDESLYTLSNIEMNQVILEDYSKLPFKTKQQDNDLAKGEELVVLWGKQGMTLDPNNMSRYTFKQFYAQLVYVIGNEGDLHNSIASNQKIAKDQLDNRRTEITGVSSEDELTNMIKYQSAYNAASRYITTIADMLQYVIEKLG